MLFCADIFSDRFDSWIVRIFSEFRIFVLKDGKSIYDMSTIFHGNPRYENKLLLRN